MKLNKQQREQLKQKYGGRCAYCSDLLPDRWHADHIEPIKRTAKFDKDKYMFVYDGSCERPENNHYI